MQVSKFPSSNSSFFEWERDQHNERKTQNGCNQDLDVGQWPMAHDSLFIALCPAGLCDPTVYVSVNPSFSPLYRSKRKLGELGSCRSHGARTPKPDCSCPIKRLCLAGNLPCSAASGAAEGGCGDGTA